MIDFKNSQHPIGFATTLLKCKRNENDAYCIQLQSKDEQQKLWRLFPVLESDVFFINGKASRILNNDAITYLENYIKHNTPPEQPAEKSAEESATNTTREIANKLSSTSSSTQNITLLTLEEIESRLKETYKKTEDAAGYETLLDRYKKLLKTRNYMRVNSKSSIAKTVITYCNKQDKYHELSSRLMSQRNGMTPHDIAWHETLLECYDNYFFAAEKKFDSQAWLAVYALQNNTEKTRQLIKKQVSNISANVIFDDKPLLHHIIAKGDDYFEMAKLLIEKAHAYPLGNDKPEKLLEIANAHDNTSKLKLLLLFYYMGFDANDMQNIHISTKELVVDFCQIPFDLEINKLQELYCPFLQPLTQYCTPDESILMQKLQNKPRTNTKMESSSPKHELATEHEPRRTLANITTNTSAGLSTNKANQSPEHPETQILVTQLYLALQPYIATDNILQVKTHFSGKDCITITAKHVSTMNIESLQRTNILLSALLFLTDRSYTTKFNKQTDELIISISAAPFENGKFELEVFLENLIYLADEQIKHKERILNLLEEREPKAPNPKTLIKPINEAPFTSYQPSRL